MFRRAVVRGVLLAVAVLVCVALVASARGVKVHHTKRGFRVGSGCEKVDESCASVSAARLCRNGVLEDFACKGLAGCVDAPPDDVACDQTVAVVGDSCAKIGALACTPDKEAQLTCQLGVFVRTNDCPSHVCSVTVTRRSVGSVKMIDTTADCH